MYLMLSQMVGGFLTLMLVAIISRIAQGIQGGACLSADNVEIVFNS